MTEKDSGRFRVVIDHDDSINADSKEEVEVMLTTIELHANIPRKPLPWYRAVMKAIRSKKEHRAYTTNIHKDQDGTMVIRYPLSPEQKREVETIEKAGKRVRFIAPPGGALVFMGKDLRQHMAAQKRKLIDDYKGKSRHKKWR